MMVARSTLQENLCAIEGRITHACERAGRKREDVLFLLVTKTQPVSAIRELYDVGHRRFAESRVQELLKKRAELPEDIQWHLIGHLQSNKARQIASFVYSVHSLDSFETGIELSKRAEQFDRKIEVLIEVNISDEDQKNGVEPSDALPLLLRIVEACPNLTAVGLMGMASFEEDVERTRPQFRKLRELRDSIKASHPELTSFKELSMGMSNDFEIAIEEGATIVRIGSALFSGNE